MEDAIGYAIATNDVIDVRTVSPAERAAKVNYLVVVKGYAVTDFMTEMKINNVWEAQKGMAKCIPITVSPR